jgi:hypothetical protein
MIVCGFLGGRMGSLVRSSPLMVPFAHNPGQVGIGVLTVRVNLISSVMLSLILNPY